MTSYANEWMGGGWDNSAETDKLDGLTVEASPENRRARGRSGFGRNPYGTLANRAHGGGSVIMNAKPEELAGRARMAPATVSSIKTRDDYGTALPSQHMLRITDEDTRVRNKARDVAAKRDIQDIH